MPLQSRALEQQLDVYDQNDRLLKLVGYPLKAGHDSLPAEVGLKPDLQWLLQ